VTLDTILWLTGDAATVAVVVVLIRGRVFSTLPVFSFYIVWSLISDLAQFAIAGHVTPYSNYSIYVTCLVIDSCFQFGVLVELSWSVLRPLRAALPRWTLPALAVLIAMVGAAVWPFVSGPGVPNFSPAGRVMFEVQESFSVLRILFFLLLAGGSQLLSIGWKDRELQIATGLGFYSLVSLAVWMQHRVGPQYHFLDQIVAVSYVCSLAYWVFAFANKEAERQQFTPQMQNLLLAMAGTARATRLAMANSASTKEPGPGQR
jgi:hypothetical protein